MTKYPDLRRVVDAKYSEPKQPLYKGNPYIEALPDNQSNEEIYQSLLVRIPYDEEERELPSHERIASVSSLQFCFQPLSEHFILAQRFSRAIKMGYVQRNPLDAEDVRQQMQLYNCVIEKDFNFQSLSFTNAVAPGFSVIGYSGMGKTSVVKRVLSIYPQIIRHTDYKGIPINKAQIVWMKLNCSHDGSVKGLCLDFFKEFDKLTGDNAYSKYSGKTTNQMIPEMALMARRHGLGVLIIDEIQFLNAAKSGGYEKALNYIIDLVNIGVPVILVGTPEAIAVLSDNLMNARRNTGMEGAVIMDFLSRTSPDWKTLMNHVWGYQWTAVKTELSEEILDMIHEKSIGDVEVAMKLYMATQVRAIRQGESNRSEIITPELIARVFESKDFKLVRDKLEEIKYSKKLYEESLLSKQNMRNKKRSDVAFYKMPLQKDHVFREESEPQVKQKGSKGKRGPTHEQHILISQVKNNNIALSGDKVQSNISAEERLYNAGKIVKPEDEF